MSRPYADLPSFDAFERVVDPSVFEAVASDSFVCLSDIVSSTAAIAEGRYKAVNMAGAAMISAIMPHAASRSVRRNNNITPNTISATPLA